MNNQWVTIKKWSHLVTLITALGTLIISLFYGPILARPYINIELPLRLQLENSYNMGLVFGVFPSVINEGRALGTIGNMGIFLTHELTKTKKDPPNIEPSHTTLRTFLYPATYQIGNSNLNLFGSFSIKPQEALSTSIFFTEDYSEETLKDMNELDIEIGHYQQQQMSGAKVIKDNPAISDDLFNRVKILMANQSPWLTKGDYKILFIVWDKYKGGKELIRRGYKFNVTDIAVSALNKYQVEGYRKPPKFTMDTFITYLPKVRLTELNKGESEFKQLNEEYEKEQKPALWPN